jgi:hypothetical protein
MAATGYRAFLRQDIEMILNEQRHSKQPPQESLGQRLSAAIDDIDVPPEVREKLCQVIEVTTWLIVNIMAHPTIDLSKIEVSLTHKL